MIQVRQKIRRRVECVSIAVLLPFGHRERAPPALRRQVDVINTRKSGPELAQSGERELNSHGQHDQPHETRDHVTRRPALAGLGGS